MSYFICLVYEGGVKAEGNGPRLNFHAKQKNNPRGWNAHPASAVRGG